MEKQPMRYKSKAYLSTLHNKKDYSFNIPYLNSNYMKVSLDGNQLEIDKDYTVNQNTITLKVAPEREGLPLIVSRHTPSDRIITWTDNSIFRAKDLNLYFIQLLHLDEENMDNVRNESIVKVVDDTWDAKGHRIKRVADPLQDSDVVNLHYLNDLATTIRKGLEQDKQEIHAKLSTIENYSGNAKQYAQKALLASNTAETIKNELNTLVSKTNTAFDNERQTAITAINKERDSVLKSLEGINTQGMQIVNTAKESALHEMESKKEQALNAIDTKKDEVLQVVNNNEVVSSVKELKGLQDSFHKNNAYITSMANNVYQNANLVLGQKKIVVDKATEVSSLATQIDTKARETTNAINEFKSLMQSVHSDTTNLQTATRDARNTYNEVKQATNNFKTVAIDEKTKQALEQNILSKVNGILSNHANNNNGVDENRVQQLLQPYARTTDLSGYAKTTALENYATKQDLGKYALVSSLNNYALSTSLSSYTPLAEMNKYVLKSELNSYVKSSTLSGYITQSQLANYATNASLNNYVQKNQFNTLNASVANLSKDVTTLKGSNFLSSSVFDSKINEVKTELGSQIGSAVGDSIRRFTTDYVTKQEVNTVIDAKVKQGLENSSATKKGSIQYANHALSRCFIFDNGYARQEFIIPITSDSRKLASITLLAPLADPTLARYYIEVFTGFGTNECVAFRTPIECEFKLFTTTGFKYKLSHTPSGGSRPIFIRLIVEGVVER